jgi:hypothetical protein
MRVGVVELHVRFRPSGADVRGIHLPDEAYVARFLGLHEAKPYQQQVAMIVIRRALRDRENPLSHYETIYPAVKAREHRLERPWWVDYASARSSLLRIAQQEKQQGKANKAP